MEPEPQRKDQQDCYEGCPECGGFMAHMDGCETCVICGNSRCCG